MTSFWLLLFSLLLHQSTAATVSEGCPSITADDTRQRQCVRVEFLVSVNEGYDSTVYVTGSDTNSLTSITIISDTPNTRLLKGYNVSIDINCQWKSLDSWRRYQQSSEEKCVVPVETCNSNRLTLTVLADSSLPSDVLYAVIEYPTPRVASYRARIYPLFNDGLNGVFGDGVDDSAPIAVSDLQEMQQCTFEEMTSVEEMTSAAGGTDSLHFGVVIAIIAGILLFLVALAVKVITLVLPQKKLQGHDPARADVSVVEIPNAQGKSHAMAKPIQKSNQENPGSRDDMPPSYKQITGL